MKKITFITMFSLRRIRKYLSSSLLVVIGISIGVGGIFAATLTGGSVQNSIDVEFTRQNVSHLSIVTSGVTPEIKEIVADIPNVKETELRLLYKTDLFYNNSWKRFILIGISDFSNIRISKFAGDPLLELSENSVILDSSARELGIKEGESVQSYSPQGPLVFTVAGFYRNPEFLSYSYSGEIIGYCQLEPAKTVSGFASPNCILVTVEDLEQVDKTHKAISTALDERNISVISFEKNTPLDYHIRDLVIQTQFLIIMVSFMVLLSACIFLWNSTTALLLEQKREIQIMENLGLGKMQRFSMYFPSRLYLVIMGTLIGLPLGWGFHGYLTSYFCGILNIETYPIFSINTLVLAGFVGIIFSSIFIIIPTFLGIRDTGKAEMAFSSSFLRFLRVFGKSFSLDIALSSISMHKARNIISIVGLAFFVCLFVVIQSTGTSIRTTLDEEIYDIRCYDFYVSFDLPTESTPEISQFIDSIEEVEHFEFWYVKEGLLDRTSVRISGIPKTTEIYNPNIVEGRYFEDTDTSGVLVSTYLSKRNQISVGDIISIDIGPRTVELEVVGIIRDADNDGKTILIPIEALQTITNSENKITHIMIDLVPSAEKISEDVGISTKEGLLKMHIYGTIRTKSESKEKTEKMTGMFLLLFYSFLVLVGVVVFINTAYTLTLNVINRKEELKLLCILGAEKSKIFRIIVVTSIMLALPAWILSLIFGPHLSEIFVHYVSTNLLPIGYTFPRSSLIFGLGLDLLISLIGTLYPIVYVFFRF